MIDSRSKSQIRVTANEKFPSRLSIVFRSGGSFSPATGTEFHISPEEGIVVFGYTGREVFPWDKVKEIHIPQTEPART